MLYVSAIVILVLLLVVEIFFSSNEFNCHHVSKTFNDVCVHQTLKHSLIEQPIMYMYIPVHFICKYFIFLQNDAHLSIKL